MTDVVTIEQRCERQTTRAFVTAETVDALANKLVGIMGERRMTATERYLGENAGVPRVFPGLRLWHGGLREAVHHTPGRWIGVWAKGARHHSFGFGVNRDETEAQARHRYEHPEENILGQRENITLVELRGWPGQPSPDDQIRIECWNNHGLGFESIVVFDDMDPLQEIAWEVKGDRVREVVLDDEFCETHNLHFEHPDHRYSGCAARQATRAETLAVLAHLAAIAEQQPPAETAPDAPAAT